MSTTIAKVTGIGLLAVGVIEFMVPDLLGLHLSPAHSVVYLVSGGLAACIGWFAAPRAVRSFCVIFGAVYALLGVAGLVAGVPGSHDTHLLRVVPGALEFGLADHLVHILLGTLLLIGGLVSAPVSGELRAPSTPRGMPRS